MSAPSEWAMAKAREVRTWWVNDIRPTAAGNALERNIAEALAAAKAEGAREEREACARVTEACTPPETRDETALPALGAKIAAAIRARGSRA